MLKLNAFFRRKEQDLKPQPCVVEKIIVLTGDDFDSFAARMVTRDWDFIKENSELMHRDEDGVMHCLLVTGESREDGILVESEGMAYARYSAHVPHVHEITAAQSPALTALGEKLSGLTDHLAGEYLTMLEGSDRAALHLYGEAMDHGVDISYSETLRQTVIEMVGERLEGRGLDMEFDNGNLIITPAGPEMEMGM